jgi:hypothetical protein
VATAEPSEAGGVGTNMTNRISLAIVLLLAAGTAGTQSRPNLNGRWVMRTEPKETADSAAVDTAATSADSAAALPDSTTADSSRSDSPPEAAGPRGRGGAGRRPQGGRRGPNEKDRRQLALLNGMSQPVPAFTIEQSDSAIVITNDDGFSYTLHPDNRRDEFVVGSDTIRVRAHWEDASLIAEYEPRGGGKMTERYTLALSKEYLRLDVTVTHKALYAPVWRPRMYRKDGR